MSELPSPRRADWSGTSRLYRGIYKVARAPVIAAARLRLRGGEHIPATGGLVVASNHWSWWDPIIVSGVMPRQVSWLAKSDLFQNPLTERFFESAAVIPIDRRAGNNAAALQRATDALTDGRVIGIFPEGTRSAPGDPLPARSGVARLALRAGVCVLPVAVASDRYWGRDMAVPKLGEPVYVKVGEPVRYDYAPEDADDRAITTKIADDVMHRVRGMLDECLAARERGEPWR